MTTELSGKEAALKLLAPMLDHPLLEKFQAPTPMDLPIDIWALRDDPLWGSLSTGEKVLLNLALVVYNGRDEEAKIADLFDLDRSNRRLVLDVLAGRLGVA